MRRLLPLLILCTSACGPATRDCPAPIGRIVLEDCREDYQANEARWRRLAELLDVPRGSDCGTWTPPAPYRTLAYWTRDLYNRCKLRNRCGDRDATGDDAPADFEALLSALEALNEPWAAAKATARPALTREARTLVAASPAPSRRGLTPSRSGTMVWLGSHFAPPRPAQAGTLPVLATWRLLSGPGFTQETVTIGFWGPVRTGDGLVLQPATGATFTCPVHPRPARPDRGQGGEARCTLPAPAGSSGSALTVHYWPQGAAAPSPMGHLSLKSAERTAPAWLAYLPTPVRRTPVTHERPWLVFNQLGPYRAGRLQPLEARCTLDGRPVGGVLVPQTPGREVSGLRRLHVPLPVSLARDPDGGSNAPDLMSASDAAGQWSCTLHAAGTVVRTVEFTLLPNGRPRVAAPQGLISPPWWPL